MKKIAHICNTALSYKVLVDKLDVLQDLGHEIYLISSQEGFDEELLKNYNFKFRFLDMEREINLLKDVKAVYKLKKILEEEQFDVVHTHTAKGGIIGRVASKLAGVPLVIHTSHGLPFYQGQNILKYNLYKTIEKIGALFCDGISSQNEEDLQIINKLVSKKIPTFYEGNGVYLERLDYLSDMIDENELNELRHKHKISKDKVVLLMGARFEPIKNHQLLIKALRKLKEEYSNNFVCILAGKGELETQIIGLIEENDLTENVRIVGHQTNIYPYIKLSNIVVLTSHKEGLPRIVMEAMTYYKPVVATDVLGTRELVVNNKTGFLIKDGNYEELAFSLNCLISDESKRTEMGLNARKRIENKFTETIVANRIDEMYKSYGV